MRHHRNTSAEILSILVTDRVLVLGLVRQLGPFLVTLLLFLAVECLITVSPLDNWLDMHDWYVLQSKLNLYRQADPQHIDILAIGTSRMESAFDPETFEAHAPVQLHTFNMGIPGSKSIVNYFQLRHLVQTFGKPRLLLLEINEFEVKTNRGNEHNQRSLSTLVRNDPGLLGEMMSSPFYTIVDKAEILFDFSALYRYRSLIRPQTLPATLTAFLTERRRHYSQWHPDPPMSPLTPTVQLATASVTLAGQFLDDADLPPVSNFTPILSFCRREGIPVVLVTLPTYPAFTLALRQHPQYWTFKTELLRLSRLYSYPYINLADEGLADGREYFKDLHHLSGTGAQFYSALLADKLFRLPLVRSVFRDQLSRRSGVGYER